MKSVGLLLLGSAFFSIHAAPVIGTVRVSKMTAVIGIPTPITVTASIPDPSLISTGVNLVQTNANGTTTILGTLHDDGINGDKFAGDLVFTAVVTLNASSATALQLQVSAAFRGQLQRAKSATVQVFFQPADTPNQALAALAQNLVAGNRAAALNYIVQSDKNTNAINTFSQTGLNALAAMLRGASLISSPSDLRIFQAPFVTPGGVAITVEIGMVPGQNGQWLVDSW